MNGPHNMQQTPLPSGRFTGRKDFQSLVRDALMRAATEDWPSLVISDADFEDWPLGERAVVQALEDWAGSGKRLTMLACHYDEVVRRHARFVRWRVKWDHIVDCFVSPDVDALNMPSVLLSPTWALHRVDPERCVFVTGHEPERRVLLAETLREWQHSKSSPGFPSTTLGL
jgi:hypothetical protein